MIRPIILKDCLKTYTLDQDKTVSPTETVAGVRDRMAETGLDVLRRTERIDNGRLGIPVFVSICGGDALKVMPTKKQMGKGASPAQAEASAVMEMVERFSFFDFWQRRPFIQAAWEDVADRALPFEHLAASVHHDATDLARARRALNGIPLSWVPALDVTRGRECLIPFDWFYEINEFNGSAAGNTIEEAVVQGLAEVVERHVSAIICRGNLGTPSIDPASLSSPVAADLTRKFSDLGIKLYLKDFTLDMGLPTVGALAYDPATFPEQSEIVYTAGTATDPEKAVIRTLTEVAQLGGDFNTRSNFMASGLPKYTAVDQAGYVIHEERRISVSDLPDISHENIRVEIERAAAVLAERGLNVYVVDVTHPVLRIPAVYVLVPGAHFRERAAASSVPFFAAKLLAERGDPGALMRELDRLGSLYPDAYYLDFHKGRVMLERGMAREAVAVLDRAGKLNPTEEDRAGILTYLGLAHKELEQYDRAVEVLERSVEVDPERMDSYNLLGVSYFKTGRYEDAIAAFEQVLRLDPGSGIDYANIGVNCMKLGRRDDAAAYFKTALELDPSLEWVWDKLAEL